MRVPELGLAALALIALAATSGRSVSATDASRVRLRMDASEAEAVLSILSELRAGREVAPEAWSRLFGTEPYRRLKRRQESFHRPFTDEEFKAFVLGADLRERAPELERTLAAWKGADLQGAAEGVLSYLPADAKIGCVVYPVIKPATNSFVFETKTNPAIFLFVDPSKTREQFRNTVAHELHHIGYASVEDALEKGRGALSPGAKTAVEWMGAFGEGFAMLAAAGGPDVHPQAPSDAADRARWDRDMSNFNEDLKALDRFFLDVAEGRLKTKEAIEERGFSFFGTQGPWYTVGYRMAVLVEKNEGRAALIDCMNDPRKLLAHYNRIAAAANAKGGAPLALWSVELLARVDGPPPTP